MSSYFITTPIYYVNDRPHIGHSYTTIIADTLARFHRLRGDQVLFVTGTDENSQKNFEAMQKAGESELQPYLDRMADVWKTTWKDIGITFDDFIRTTEPRHITGVERFWRAVFASGDLEKRTYEALYCVGCEGFKTPSEMNEEGRCPLHPNKELTKVQEENWFFKLTNYADALKTHIEAHPEFVLPASRRNEILGYIEAIRTEKLDVSVSREKKKLAVGIPVPGDDDQRIYVWFDALLNYMTVAGYGTDDAKFATFWPADLHLVGKDILKFHCALWPAMIMSAAKNDPALRHEDGSPKLPKHVFAHGFYTLEGQKISKSLGNAIDPRDLAKQYPLDAIRYFLLREISLGSDGDFAWDRLRERYVSDLGNTFGNLLNRAIAMSKKYFDGNVPPRDHDSAPVSMEWGGEEAMMHLVRAVEEAYVQGRPDEVLQMMWTGLGTETSAGLLQANKYIEETQPFKLIKTNPEETARVLYDVLEACRLYAWMIAPCMPSISTQIFTQLGLDASVEARKAWSDAVVWGGLVPGSTLGEPVPLFPRLPVAETEKVG
jgi:methionyl-tRNA synthetase